MSLANRVGGAGERTECERERGGAQRHKRGTVSVVHDPPFKESSQNAEAIFQPRSFKRKKFSAAQITYRPTSAWLDRSPKSDPDQPQMTAATQAESSKGAARLLLRHSDSP
ncbi:hypothetical protein GCM10018966_100840 [Streptomyces yanii]